MQAGGLGNFGFPGASDQNQFGASNDLSLGANPYFGFGGANDEVIKKMREYLDDFV